MVTIYFKGWKRLTDVPRQSTFERFHVLGNHRCHLSKQTQTLFTRHWEI